MFPLECDIWWPHFAQKPGYAWSPQWPTVRSVSSVISSTRVSLQASFQRGIQKTRSLSCIRWLSFVLVESHAHCFWSHHAPHHRLFGLCWGNGCHQRQNPCLRADKANWQNLDHFNYLVCSRLEQEKDQKQKNERVLNTPLKCWLLWCWSRWKFLGVGVRQSMQNRIEICIGNSFRIEFNPMWSWRTKSTKSWHFQRLFQFGC